MAGGGESQTECGGGIGNSGSSTTDHDADPGTRGDRRPRTKQPSSAGPVEPLTKSFGRDTLAGRSARNARFDGSARPARLARPAPRIRPSDRRAMMFHRMSLILDPPAAARSPSARHPRMARLARIVGDVAADPTLSPIPVLPWIPGIDPTRVLNPWKPVLADDDDDETSDIDFDDGDDDDSKSDSGFNDGLEDDEDVDEFDDIDEDDFDDDFDDDFEEELEDDYEIEIEDEISTEFGLNSPSDDDDDDDEDDLDDFEDFEAVE